MFSQRTSWNLETNPISSILAELRQSQATVWDLTESNPTRCGFAYPQESILAPLSDPQNMVYAPAAQGNMSARETVCAYYRLKGIKVDPSQVFLTAGTSEAYAFLFRLLADPGDEVVFPRPSYPLFKFLGDLNDIRLKFYPLVFQEGWRIDGDALSDQLSPATKAVVVVNPNNPTGSFLKPKEREHLSDICARAGIPLIADEVFLDYVLDERVEPLSLAGNPNHLTFTLGGLSKGLGLPQMKLSWIVVSGPDSPAAEAAARLEIITDTYLSVNTPVQNALRSWLPLQPVIQRQIMDRIKANREFLEENLNVNRLMHPSTRCLPTEGGWYALLRLADHFDEEQLVKDLLEKDQVYVHPGYFFDFQEGVHLILSLLPEENIFQEGITRVIRRIKEL